MTVRNASGSHTYHNKCNLQELLNLNHTEYLLKVLGTCFCFFLRKISPELTSAANPPLFAEEDWP